MIRMIQASRSLYRILLLEVVPVVVDQAACLDDLSLGVGQIAQADFEFLDAILGDCICLDVVVLLVQGLADVRYIDEIAERERKLLVRTLEQERKHAPVDEVGTIPLGGVLVGNVRPSAENLLAGSGLLTSRAIAGLDSENGGADGDLHGIDARELGLQAIIGSSEALILGSLAILTAILDGLDSLGVRDIVRILAAKRELRKADRVRTVRGGLTGRNQLVSRGDRIMDLGDDLQHDVIGKSGHRRPILDVGTKLKLDLRMRDTLAVVNPLLVNGAVEVVRVLLEAFEALCAGKEALVGSGGCDGAGVHKSDGSDLSVLDL